MSALMPTVQLTFSRGLFLLIFQTLNVARNNNNDNIGNYRSVIASRVIDLPIRAEVINQSMIDIDRWINQSMAKRFR